MSLSKDHAQNHLVAKAMCCSLDMIEKSFKKLDLFPEARWLSRVFVSDCMPRGREIAERTDRAGLFEAASSGELMGLFNLPSDGVAIPIPIRSRESDSSHTPKMQTRRRLRHSLSGARIGEAGMTNGRGRSLHHVQSSTLCLISSYRYCSCVAGPGSF